MTPLPMGIRIVAVTACALLGLGPPARGQDLSLVPLGGDEAARIVDRFVEAVNSGAVSELERFLTPDARWAQYSYGIERLREQDWVPRFWHVALLQLRFPGYPPSWTADGEVRVTVVERIASGSVVVQRELWTGRPEESAPIRRFEALAYQLRGGRIHRVWYLPKQYLEVPAGVRPRAARCPAPAVWFDAAHNNTSSADGMYAQPASVLRAAGYPVRVLVDAPLTAAMLDTMRVLAVVNALPDGHADARSDPDDLPPSAFTQTEMDALEAWVRAGGRLLLIADHDPWPAASATLAARFGARFQNGAAVDTTRPRGGGDLFTRADGALRSHPITDGSGQGERVDSVRTFLGQAFEARPPLQPLLVLHGGMKLAPPGTLGGDASSWIPVGGLAQAAAGTFDAGRIAILGEAWVLRFLGPSLEAGNTRFLLNLFDWLTEDSC